MRGVPGPRPRAEARHVEEENGVDLVLAQLGGDVNTWDSMAGVIGVLGVSDDDCVLTVALHTDKLAELLPLGLEQVHPARLGVVHLVPGKHSDIVRPVLLSCDRLT